jgi:hypothetical protein
LKKLITKTTFFEYFYIILFGATACVSIYYTLPDEYTRLSGILNFIVIAIMLILSTLANILSIISVIKIISYSIKQKRILIIIALIIILLHCVILIKYFSTNNFDNIPVLTLEYFLSFVSPIISYFKFAFAIVYLGIIQLILVGIFTILHKKTGKKFKKFILVSFVLITLIVTAWIIRSVYLENKYGSDADSTFFDFVTLEAELVD